MQSRGQYGVPEQPQYVVGRPPPQHIFAISHDNMSALSPSAAVHNRHAEHHPQHQHSHQQQAQHHHQHLHGPHPGHQPHPSLHPQQQQQQQQPQPHQTLSPHAAHAPHVPQHQHGQHPHHHQTQQQQQQHQHQPSPAPHQQVHQHTSQQAAQAQAQAQAQKQAQNQMVQQLGLGGGPDSPEDPSPVGSRPSPTHNSKQVVTVEHDDEEMEDEGRSASASGSRWPRQETLALIKLRSDMDANFRDSGLKGPLWEELSRKLAELGYHRSAKKCKEKFENVHKYYKKTKDGRAGRQDGKSYRFFSELEKLYGSQQAAAQAEANAGGARLLLPTGSAVPTIAVPTTNGVHVAQWPSEVSTCATISDSSEDDYEEPTAGGEGDKQGTNNKKRKRLDDEKPGSSKKEFMESLVKKLMSRLEAMQHEFLNSLQRREQERQVREEAWRRQEMELVQRENELRNEERARAASREAVLVAFLQKVAGQTFQLPHPPPPNPPPVTTPHVSVSPIPIPSLPVVPVPVVPVVHQQPTITTTPIASPKPNPPPLPPSTTFEEPESKVDGSFDPTSSRWPKPEVHALIRLRSEMETRFQEAGPKGPLWEQISTGMACLGYNRNSKRCKEKWENINKYFKKTKESNKKRPENAKTCPYFHQLENLYRQGKLGTPHNKGAKAIIDNQAHELTTHQAVPIGSRDAASVQDAAGQPEVLKMLPPPPEVGQVIAASTGNGAAGQIASSPEDGGSVEADTKKGIESTA